MIETIALGLLSTILTAVSFFLGYKSCSRLYAKEAQEFERKEALFREYRQDMTRKLFEANENATKSEENGYILAQELSKMTKKLEAALSANYNFEKSRDDAWDLYRRSSLAAGNAQSLLFREIQKLQQLVNKYRSKLGEEPLNSPQDLEELVAEFANEHIKEAKRKAQQL